MFTHQKIRGKCYLYFDTMYVGPCRDHDGGRRHYKATRRKVSEADVTEDVMLDISRQLNELKLNGLKKLGVLG